MIHSARLPWRDERLEDLELERKAMEFLYRDASNFVFMNPDNYEQSA